jgi:hypothetical protein
LNTKSILVAIGLGTGCLLLAADQPKQGAPGIREPNLGEPKPAVEVSKTDRFDFPANGTLHFINSVGVLTVEAWDRFDVEITTIKSTKGDVDAGGIEKATTKFPGHRPFGIFYPLSGNTGFNLEYRIKAPASARIVARHTLGQVNIDGLAGDIQVHLSQGEILLHLPEEQKYEIHAQSSFGSVDSDFSESEKRTGWLLGHRSVDDSAAPHKLNLKVRFGDIVILKINVPKSSEPIASAPKADGL